MSLRDDLVGDGRCRCCRVQADIIVRYRGSRYECKVIDTISRTLPPVDYIDESRQFGRYIERRIGYSGLKSEQRKELRDRNFQTTGQPGMSVQEGKGGKREVESPVYGTAQRGLQVFDQQIQVVVIDNETCQQAVENDGPGRVRQIVPVCRMLEGKGKGRGIPLALLGKSRQIEKLVEQRWVPFRRYVREQGDQLGDLQVQLLLYRQPSAQFGDGQRVCIRNDPRLEQVVQQLVELGEGPGRFALQPQEPVHTVQEGQGQLLDHLLVRLYTARARDRLNDDTLRTI